MDKARYSIEELVEKTGFPRRTIRYYVQEGLLPPPAGRGRGGFYNDSHLAILQRIQSLRGRGYTLSAIADMVRLPSMPQQTAEPEPQLWLRYEVAPGVEIHVSRDTEQRESRRLFELLRAARSILKEEMDEANG